MLNAEADATSIMLYLSKKETEDVREQETKAQVKKKTMR